MEGEALDVIHAFVGEVQVDHQLVLTVGQLVLGLGAAIQRAAGDNGVGTVGAGQTALRQVGALLVMLEQRERQVRTILAEWVLGQAQLHHIATTRVDGQFEDIGLHLDQLAVGGSRLRGVRQTRAGARRGRNVGASSAGGGHGSIRQTRGLLVEGRGLRRQLGLTVILVPLENQRVGHDCQGDE